MITVLLLWTVLAREQSDRIADKRRLARRSFGVTERNFDPGRRGFDPRPPLLSFKYIGEFLGRRLGPAAAPGLFSQPASAVTISVVMIAIAAWLY